VYELEAIRKGASKTKELAALKVTGIEFKKNFDKNNGNSCES